MGSTEQQHAAVIMLTKVGAALVNIQRGKAELGSFFHTEDAHTHASPIQIAQIKDIYRDLEAIERRLVALSKESYTHAKKGATGIHAPLTR